MNISQKIEEIRRKPEHVRLRYVWGAVFVTMFFIIIIWIFSMKENYRAAGQNGMSPLADFKNELEKSSGNTDSATQDMREGASILQNELSK